MAALGGTSRLAASGADVHPKHEDGHILGFEAPVQSSLQEAITAIERNVRHPAPGPWGAGDVEWRMLERTQRGSHGKTPVVQQCYVNSDRVNDFVAGMEGAKGGISCKYVVIEKYVFKVASRVRATAGLLFRRFERPPVPFETLTYLFLLEAVVWTVFETPHVFYRFSCQYGPQDYSGIVKDITEDMVPKTRKKRPTMKNIMAGESTAPPKPPRKPRARKVKLALTMTGTHTTVPGRKRQKPHKVPVEASTPPSLLDLNEPPSTTAPPKPPRKPRARKVSQPVTGACCHNTRSTDNSGQCPDVGGTGCCVQSKRAGRKPRAPRKADAVVSTPPSLFDLNEPPESAAPPKPPRKPRARKVSQTPAAACCHNTGSTDNGGQRTDVGGTCACIQTTRAGPNPRAPRYAPAVASEFPTLVDLNEAPVDMKVDPPLHNTDSDRDITAAMSRLTTSIAQKPELPDLNLEPPVEETTTKPKAKRDSRKKWGESIKRGCKASFTVKSLYHLPHISEICIIHPRHTNDRGLVVHGDLKIGDRSALQAHLSQEMIEKVQGWIREGYSVAQIMDKHLEDLQVRFRKGSFDVDRDVFLEEQDVYNLANGVYGETWRLHKHDASSVRMWVQRNPHEWFYYKETTTEEVRGALTGSNMPFTLGIQTSWQKKMMLKYGHAGGISMDATFGTNSKKVQS